MAGRMQHRAKRRKERRIVEGPGEGLKLASDLMGPFEQELMGHLYSIIKRLPGGYPRWQLSKPPGHSYMVAKISTW